MDELVKYLLDPTRLQALLRIIGVSGSILGILLVIWIVLKFLEMIVRMFRR